MPGAGKSTIGVVLAKILGFEFLDTDLLIQKEEGKRLWQIIDESGLQEFLSIEERVNSSISAHHKVIAPGGSVVYSQKTMEHFRQLGTIIYLDVDLDLLEKRIGNFEHRGVVNRQGETLKEIYKERLPLYKKYADIIVHETDDSISLTAAAILNALGIVH